jgi:hypothetical protein
MEIKIRRVILARDIMHTKFLLGNLKGRDYSEDIGIDGKIILNRSYGNRWEGVDWMHLAQDEQQWWAVVNTVMNHRVP